MSLPLPPPDSATSQRLLGSLGYDQRFVGYRLQRRLGAHPVNLYGLVDLLALLCLDHPRVHIGKLADWVAAEVGDEELAERIRTIAEQPGSQHVRQLALAQLIESRLLQAVDALEPGRV